MGLAAGFSVERAPASRVGAVRRAIVERKASFGGNLLLAAAVVALATAARAGLEPWIDGLPFLTLYPAVLVAAIFLGWRWGAAALIASAAIANYVFQTPLFAFALSATEVLATVCFLLFGAMMVWASEALRRAVLDLDAAARREAELNLELQHRVNNNLAVVQALARQTARVTPEPETFYQSFSARLMAISEANKVLTQGGWEVTPLPELVVAALRPFDGADQISVAGPRCVLPPISCVPLVLAIHELGTNAAKFGALSTTGGRVHLEWGLEGSACRLTWRETRGPQVHPPARRGVGSRLLTRQSGLDQVNVTFGGEGLTCEILVLGARPMADSQAPVGNVERLGAA